jgi:hypothetical protein
MNNVVKLRFEDNSKQIGFTEQEKKDIDREILKMIAEAKKKEKETNF